MSLSVRWRSSGFSSPVRSVSTSQSVTNFDLACDVKEDITAMTDNVLFLVGVLSDVVRTHLFSGSMDGTLAFWLGVAVISTFSIKVADYLS